MMKPLLQHTGNLRLIILRVLIALVLTATGGAASAMEMQSVGTGEDVNLENLTGNGKWTLVMIWATNCHICRVQKPEISAFHDKSKDVEVIGIALDGPDRMDAVKQYIVDTKPSFPNYVTDSAVLASYYFGMTEENIRGTPTYLLFNPEGELLGNNPGKLSVDAIESFIERKSQATG